MVGAAAGAAAGDLGLASDGAGVSAGDGAVGGALAGDCGDRRGRGIPTGTARDGDGIMTATTATLHQITT